MWRRVSRKRRRTVQGLSPWCQQTDRWPKQKLTLGNRWMTRRISEDCWLNLRNQIIINRSSWYSTCYWICNFSYKKKNCPYSGVIRVNFIIWLKLSNLKKKLQSPLDIFSARPGAHQGFYLFYVIIRLLLSDIVFSKLITWSAPFCNQ